MSGSRERADWVRNLRADPAVVVRVGDGEEVAATARVLEGGSDEDARARGLVLAKYQRPGASDLQSWGRSALVVAFDLDRPSAG